MRDNKTGFTFFNVEGDQYDYDARPLLSITGGRLLVSNEFAKALGRRQTPGQLRARSPSARMQPIETISSTKTATLNPRGYQR